MQYTSAQAAKLLRALNEEYAILVDEDDASSLFRAAVTEDVESARPAYDFDAMLARQEELNRKIRVVKHAINVFNTTHTLPGFDMTIDEALVRLPQMTRLKEKLTRMSKRLEKQRVTADYGSSPIIEYEYANYSIAKAREQLSEVTATLGAMQTALDIVNTHETMDIDI